MCEFMYTWLSSFSIVEFLLSSDSFTSRELSGYIRLFLALFSILESIESSLPSNLEGSKSSCLFLQVSIFLRDFFALMKTCFGLSMSLRLRVLNIPQ